MKTLRAFYHRTRRTFVPMLAEEIAAKSSQPVDDVMTELRILARQGYVTGSFIPNVKCNAWHLTPSGQAKAMEIIHAEAMMRSV